MDEDSQDVFWVRLDRAYTDYQLALKLIGSIPEGGTTHILIPLDIPNHITDSYFLELFDFHGSCA